MNNNRVPFRTTIDEDLLAVVKHKAITNECNANDIIEEALYSYLGKSIEKGEMLISEWPYTKQMAIIEKEIKECLFHVAEKNGIILHDEISDAICLESVTLAKLFLGNFNEFETAEKK